jgi:drug/metabolite transporter (DMT)-like permease
MKPYALTLAASITIIFILRIFYPGSVINISHNLNLFSVSEITTQEAKFFIYIYLVGAMFLNYVIFHKHILFKLIYCLLITISIVLIVFSLKQF